MLGDEVVNSGGVCEQPLLHLKTMESIKLCVLLENRCNYFFQLPLLPKGLPFTCGFAYLASEVQAESTV